MLPFPRGYFHFSLNIHRTNIESAFDRKIEKQINELINGHNACVFNEFNNITFAFSLRKNGHLSTASVFNGHLQTLEVRLIIGTNMESARAPTTISSFCHIAIQSARPRPIRTHKYAVLFYASNEKCDKCKFMAFSCTFQNSN